MKEVVITQRDKFYELCDELGLSGVYVLDTFEILDDEEEAVGEISQEVLDGKYYEMKEICAYKIASAVALLASKNDSLIDREDNGELGDAIDFVAGSMVWEYIKRKCNQFRICVRCERDPEPEKGDKV